MTNTDPATAVREALAKMTPGRCSGKELAKTLEAGIRARPELAKFHDTTDYQADGDGFAALKNHTPALLAERDALAAEVARLREALRALRDRQSLYSGGHDDALVAMADAALEPRT